MIETIAVASVRPYPVVTVANGSSARIRRSSAAGTVAAPTKPMRSDDRSANPAAPVRPCSSSDQNNVGGPARAEMRSSAISERAASMSRTGMGTAVAPRSRQAIHPALYPKQWKNGLTIR